MPNLLTVRDTASALSVSHWTVRRLIACGALPHVRIGKAVRIDQRALEDFVSAHTGNSNNQKSK